MHDLQNETEFFLLRHVNVIFYDLTKKINRFDLKELVFNSRRGR